MSSKFTQASRIPTDRRPLPHEGRAYEGDGGVRFSTVASQQDFSERWPHFCFLWAFVWFQTRSQIPLNSSGFSPWHSSTSTLPLTEELNTDVGFHSTHSTPPTADTLPRNVFQMFEGDHSQSLPCKPAKHSQPSQHQPVLLSLALPSTPTCPPTQSSGVNARPYHHLLQVKERGQSQASPSRWRRNRPKRPRVTTDRAANGEIFKPQQRTW